MESIFSNPLKVKDLIEKGMEGKLEEGELDQIEIDALEGALTPPGKANQGEDKKLMLRSDGGSGERKASIAAPSHPQRESVYSESWEKAGEEDTSKEWTEEKDEDTTGSRGGGSESIALLRREVGELRLYVEDAVKAMGLLITPIQERIQKIEIAVSPSIPFATLPGSHHRQPSDKGKRPTSPPTTKSGVGIPYAGTPRPVVSQAMVSAFFSKNRDYPSLKAVREAKLKQLQMMQNLPPTMITVGVSEWTEAGLYTALVKEHEGGS